MTENQKFQLPVMEEEELEAEKLVSETDSTWNLGKRGQRTNQTMKMVMPITMNATIIAKMKLRTKAHEEDARFGWTYAYGYGYGLGWLAW